MWSGWKRKVMNIVVLVVGLGIGMLLWFEVLGRLFFGKMVAIRREMVLVPA